jgi:hypothetical protein
MTARLIPLLILLTACTQYGEAGNMDNGSFGNATMQNTLAMAAGANGRASNGKYAAFVMGEYVAGATRVHPSNTEVKSQVDPTAGK